MSDSGEEQNLRSRPKSGVVDVQLGDTEPRQLRFLEFGDLALFEGDICLGTLARIAALKKSGALLPQGIARTDRTARWPKGVVPFHIASTFVNRKRIDDAIAHWKAKTKITFVEMNGLNSGKYNDYIYFDDRGGCWSYIGRQKNEQVISISTPGTVGNVIHEIGHALGLWHEQSRSDRDMYVTIQEENIDLRFMDNFDQPTQDAADLGAYDYGSIMHYGAKAFSVNNKPTIVPKNGAAIGQRDGLSDGDIASIEEIYSELYP